VNYSLWGLDPKGYHLFALLVHGLNTLLVYGIAREILKNNWTSLLAGLFFAVHPIHTESITFMTTSFDEAGVVFFLAAFYLYLRSNRAAVKKRVYWGSVIFFLLAIFTYEVTLTLPLVIAAYDYAFNKKKLSVMKYLPFFLVAFFYLFIRVIVLNIGARAEGYPGGSFYLTVLTVFKVYLYYIKLTLIPVNLSVDHAISVAASFFEPRVLVAIALILLVLLFALKLSKSKVVFFGVTWFFITLLPVSNIVPMPNLMAERYLYLPSVGFSIILANLFDINAYKKPLIRYEKLRRAAVPGAVLLLLFYSAITIDRNTDWKDDFSLWSKTVKTSPNSYVAHYNLAIEYVNTGKSEEAVHHYKEAIRINPLYVTI
jgi:tetratricopeptide (TPR) repeat protein